MEEGARDVDMANDGQIECVTNIISPENIHNERKPATISVSQNIFPITVKSESDVYRHETLYEYKTNADRFFCCELCLVWFVDISELLVHITDEHEYKKISEDVKSGLYQQWEEILKIEKTILDLVVVKKFNSAKRSLKTFMPSLNSIETKLFNSKTNVFKHFIESMQSRIKMLIKEGKINTANELKKINVVLPENYNAFSNKSTVSFVNKTDKNKEKKIHKKKRVFVKDNISVNFLSDFSSEDDLCLKDTIKNMEQDITNNIKVEDNISIESEDCVQLEEVTYYVIPERVDGKMITFLEMSSIHTAMKDVLKKKISNLDLFGAILFRRFDMEVDEVLPEGAIVVTEWVSSEMKYESWSTMTFNDFLNKNVTKMQKNSISSTDILHDESDETIDDFSINDSNIGESLEVKIEENSSELNIPNTDDILFSNQSNETITKQIDNDYKCQTCGIIFTYKGKLLQHELRFHSKSLENRSNSYNKIKFSKDSYDAPECNICFRKFTSLGRLTQHMDIAHGGKVFLKNGRKKNSLLDNLNEDVNAAKTSDE